MKPKVLVITTLYPNAIQFRHGIFVETRIKHLQQSGQVNITVIAPVPWFPFNSEHFPVYAKYAEIPRQEVRYGLNVYHPRYLVIPKIGMLLTPFFLAYSIYREIKQLLNHSHQFDLIDCHYYYPDGVAAAIVSKIFKLPLAITARGSDINLIADFFLPRKMMLWAGKVATLNNAVCEALRQRMIEIGIKPETTRVFRNGVDLDLFIPLDRNQLRKKWQIQDKLLVSVGNLIELKGHHLIIQAMISLTDYRLFIVGAGEWEDKLKAMTVMLGLEDRIRFLGERKQEELVELYNCADALVLASSREGWANVLLEALACGTPVVVTNISGTPEVIAAPEAGVLCDERSAEGIVDGVCRLFENYPSRKETRLYAEKFSWQETTDGIVKAFTELAAKTALR
jgi:glycosyltransferase involved in cell wall biosynthesis